MPGELWRGLRVGLAFFAAIAAVVFLLVGLLWFVGATKHGKAMRATAQDPDAARLMGIDVDRTIQLTFLLGGLMAGGAGMLWMMYREVTRFNVGFIPGLKAVHTGQSELAVFVVLIAILLVRPRGLMGQEA